MRHARAGRGDRAPQEGGWRTGSPREPHALAGDLPLLRGPARRRWGHRGRAEVQARRLANAAPQPLSAEQWLVGPSCFAACYNLSVTGLMSPRGAELLRRAVLFFASMLAATFVVAGVGLTHPAADDGADRYIVVLDDGVDHPLQVASGIEQRENIDIGVVYSNVLEGFSAEIPEEDLAAVRADPRVERVVPDGKVYLDQTLPWGVDMVGADTSSTLAGNGSGTVFGVNAYVIDTGIYRGPTSP